MRETTPEHLQKQLFELRPQHLQDQPRPIASLDPRHGIQQPRYHDMRETLSEHLQEQLFGPRPRHLQDQARPIASLDPQRRSTTFSQSLSQ
ncbi:unnamed protein product [Ceutorhynchus assimilis]|uniref:Uncharacterized protein n=1 Tax=Ceutorhynchus assimilis TaxID=467358 RepID=A0A9N9MU76_9CUCU|nr:unnamed protein product [Ceutorhynchus assimilis]